MAPGTAALRRLDPLFSILVFTPEPRPSAAGPS